MAYPYITQADVEKRIGSTQLRRILDDDRDGLADTDAVTQAIQDGCAKVAGALRPMYDLAAVAAAPPSEVLRLSLDATVAYLIQRHPEVVRRDWVPLMMQVDADLKRIRNGETRLDVEGSPEPGENAGADYTVGDPETFDEDTFKPDFSWGTSDF